MKFVLEVDLDKAAWDGNAVTELERILRYWGGNLRHYKLAAGDNSAIYDSSYAEVGQWSVTDDPPDPESHSA